MEKGEYSKYVINLTENKRLIYGCDPESPLPGYYLKIVDTDVGHTILQRGYSSEDVITKEDMLTTLESHIPVDLEKLVLDSQPSITLLEKHKLSIAANLPF